MLHTMMAASLQDVHETHQIRIHVGVGILNGIPHPGLRGQVDDSLGLFLCEESLHAGAVGQVELVETETRTPAEFGQPGLLQADVVVVVEVVESDHLIPPPQQQLGGVETNESGRAGDEDFHNLILTVSRPLRRHASATNTAIQEPQLLHLYRVQQVAAVKNNGRRHGRFNTGPVESTELRPLSGNHQRIAARRDRFRL